MNSYFSFPRDHRLLNKIEYNSVFDTSSKVSQKYLLALYKPNEKYHGRLGIIVGKRVANLAVTRNKIKRAIRESFRIHQEQLKGLDIVIIARQHCGTLDKVQLRESMDTLWQKLVYANQSHI